MHMPLRGFEHYICVLRPQHGQGRKSKNQSLKNLFGIYGQACPLLTSSPCHCISISLYRYVCVCVSLPPLSLSLCVCAPPSLPLSHNLSPTSLYLPQYPSLHHTLSLSLSLPPSPSIVVGHPSPSLSHTIILQYLH